MLTMLQQKQLKKNLLLFIGILALSPTSSFGATLYLEPEKTEYYQDDTFLIEIFVDTEGESINVVETELTFPTDVLEVKDITSGNSILSLWVEKPTFSNAEGKIFFVGGIPGSYTGKRGKLGEIVFTTKLNTDETHTADITFANSSKILLSDYKGTEAPVRTRGALLTIFSETTLSSSNEWDERLENDTTPPEPFRIEIARDPQIFSQEYFVVFSTTDKQSGMERYEIKEGNGQWMQAESPYRLQNQSSSKEVMVRAIDKAGNERIQMIQFEVEDGHIEINWKHIVYSLCLFIVIGGVLWRTGILYKRRKNMSTL